MRMQHDRSFYIPEGATKVQDDQSTAVAYLSEYADGHKNPYRMVAFQGKAQKPALHYVYPNAERRAERMQSFFESVRITEQERKRRREQRKAAPVGLEVGDVLSAMWGYEQTNVDYYQVTEVKGRYVTLRPIAAQTEETGWLRGKSIPVPGKFTGEPFRKQARDGQVKLTSYSWASKIEPEIEVDGVKMYRPSNYTAYA